METRPPRGTRQLAAAGTALIGLLFASGSAFAQALYWKTSGKAGVWSVADNWSADAAGTAASTSAPASATDAVFVAHSIAGQAVTVTLGGVGAVNSLTFNANETTTLAGGVIALAGAGGRGITASSPAVISSALVIGTGQNWVVTVGNDNRARGLSISGDISGGGGVTLAGGGNLTLAGANTFTGGVNVGGGSTLTLAGATAAGIGVITVNDGILQGQTSGPFVGPYANAMVWNGNITLITTAKASVWRGDVTLGASGITLASDGNYPSKVPVIAGVISDGGKNLGLAIGGSVVLGGAGAYGGATLINPGANLYLGGSVGNGNAAPGGGGALSPGGTIIDNGTLTFNRTDTAAQGIDFAAGAITGAGNLVLAGGGTVILKAANSYAGATTITAGTLRAGAADVIAATRRLVLNGGAFDAAGFSQRMASTALSLAADSTIDLGSGSANVALVFADSSSMPWAPGATLRFINVGSGDTIQFGASGSALTAAQLARITLNGETAALDASGFLSAPAAPSAAPGIPEPSAYSLR